IVKSPVTERRYKIGPVIGTGGYGKAYRAFDLTNKAPVCLKYTFDQLSWHRESYFGELLRRNPRVIQIYDSFPVMPRSGRGRIRYCLVLELAEHGTVADYLKRTGKPWTESRAAREIKALLRVLDQLHGGSATHRDITPFNIFVCKNGVLKLGDFGIARHELAGHRQKPEAFNPDYVTRGIIDEEHRAWQAVDDVFQMGQLLALLLLGRPRDKVTLAELRRAQISPELKAIIRRAIGPRSRRYHDAWEMLQALRGDPAPPPSRLKSLSGKRIVFTGPLSISRLDAALLAAQAGAIVEERVTKNIDVLVQGRARGSEGRRSAKLIEVERLIRQGRRIDVIGEAEFRRLVRIER
ncbi:MAG TPA: protein kinase, partial [Sandaracinaceae bacterium]